MGGIADWISINPYADLADHSHGIWPREHACDDTEFPGRYGIYHTVHSERATDAPAIRCLRRYGSIVGRIGRLFDDCHDFAAAHCIAIWWAAPK